jgi:GDP-D-mannose dehydratase
MTKAKTALITGVTGQDGAYLRACWTMRGARGRVSI